jgi:1-deoxy-D-xylulose-5-phosphate reductoisomerase
MQTKKIFIAGSTGSIGTQTLAICKEHNIEVSAISAHSNYMRLVEQAKEFNVKKVHIYNSEHYKALKELLPDVEVYTGEESLNELIYDDDADTLINAIVGSAGLLPTIFGIKSKKKIALANKETIVCAGELIMDMAKENGVTIFPVDSEHSAIFQCLIGNNYKDVKKIILTASGGPFFGMTDLDGIKVSDALAHPNWAMGKKITIDSATLMNKGLEVIEAYHLFQNKPIEVLVHRESIIHSMVEYVDNAIMAQLGIPDMTIPIQLALTYPNRFISSANAVDFLKLKTLSFYEPDTKLFRCLNLAYEALKIGGTMPCVLNSANEVAVDLFLNEKIKFKDIPNIIEKAMEKHSVIANYTIEQIQEIDKQTRKGITI